MHLVLGRNPKLVSRAFGAAAKGVWKVTGLGFGVCISIGESTSRGIGRISTRKNLHRESPSKVQQNDWAAVVHLRGVPSLHGPPLLSL
jgi:hypothetical protein